MKHKEIVNSTNKVTVNIEKTSVKYDFFLENSTSKRDAERLSNGET